MTGAHTNWTPDPAVGHLLHTLRRFRRLSDADEEEEFLESILQCRELNALVKAHNVILFCNQEQCPVVSNGCQIAGDVMEDIRPYALMIEECRELYGLLTTPHVKNLLLSHDTIAQRDYLPKLCNVPYEVDEDEDTIKMVQLIKSNDPLGDQKSTEPIVGATIKAEEATGRILIARVMHGGAADRSGLISVGDEIIEVNGINVEGKSPNDVLRILQMAQNTITFKLIPNENRQMCRESRIRLRALFDYDPSDDKYIPCKEAGLPFVKGEIIHIVSQDDPYWWQARKEQDRNMRAGLIPSRALQERRIVQERNEISKEDQGVPASLICGGLFSNSSSNNYNTMPDPSSYTLCTGNELSMNGKIKKVIYDLTENEEFDKDEIATYEEVARLFPRPGSYRPIVLIGPPGVGRNELKRRIIALDPDRHKATVPHTSRPKKPGEVHGTDYYFTTRDQMQVDINLGKFIEHGEYRGNLYGTSTDGIRDLIHAGIQPIICPHYQALKMLRTAELKPFIIYIEAPPFERLKETRHQAYARSTFDETSSRAFTDEEFVTMIRLGQKVESHYGHWIDLTIVNEDLNEAFEQLVKAIRRLDQDAHWVPVSWVQ
ncbi:MAGUK p55 subfamily member 4,MAGUK p55 subfamily member 7 [Lepeophtheirus salmonis]|uniref:MAGUK p55 subfamily member 4,MAGUK p55 subfamily member 7 n=1 Tax=Lepeophtheirus salmonis TaxID=72036 RepID=A0A0K2T4Y8_LEPSM|nr:MAGUK p55 subfamily member 7-like isoform X1 [Lepeophtheirus salmonis]CAB4065525.1 MAGUK p55 subfamily member 4,MAGUK p55 subfamily member 7 [Lepeophtheirus salmonis]CAF2958541.1 MAGUK p55 subfamily member 4,MAGUK p55 subfamily member 7 [Lepeophtheirus salmonis]